ncbi:MAG: OmpA family protein [Myxococcales bacterium]|nr:OmpA family protein [Myxococcales bacterium]
MIFQALASLLVLAEPAAAATVTATTTPSAAGSSAASRGPAAPERWILRHRPRAHALSLGLYGGVMGPARGLAVRDPGAVGEYSRAAPEVGLRLGYYPSRFFGLEGELSLLPTRFADQRAFLYAARAQAVIQAGWTRVVPFVSLGGGALAVASPATAAGREVKPALNVGGGVKLNASELLAVRVDVRDVVTAAIAADTRPRHSLEALISLELRFDVAPKPAPPAPTPTDADGDGVADPDDWCSHEAGTDPHGCPYRDRDCDEVRDIDDACPTTRGVTPGGCPPPDRDTDGVTDDLDACPDQVGPAPGGCPDADGDGIVVPVDRCPDVAETVNGVADDDGCADDLPQEVRRFRGVIEGIRFANNKATILPESQPVLDDAARVLAGYPALRIEIVGHTDDRGQREKNVDLSRRRAEAVRDYLVGKGVAAERLTPRGAGPDQPVADNRTAAGRAQNRRIEFRTATVP